MPNKEYKRLSIKEAKQLSNVMSSVYDGAAFLQKNFVDKKVTYIGENNERFDIIFGKINFMHLCGINYRRGAFLFFEDSIDRKINMQDIEIKRDGSTFQKLQVISNLSMLLCENIIITGSGRYTSLQYDAAIRSRRKILALALKKSGIKYVPISLLNLKTKEIGPGQKVKQILIEDLSTNAESTIVFDI